MKIEEKLNPDSNSNDNLIMDRYLEKYSELLIKKIENKLK
jgi:hypothetical protein